MYARSATAPSTTAPCSTCATRSRAGGEQGLLGVTFSPDGATMYVDYTNTNGDTRVDAYPMQADGTANRGGRRELLAIDQPQPNHNGGNVVTGPDGMLWIGTGDGGAAGDSGAGHAPQGNGQSVDTLLGKLLRIDPTPAGSKPYSIPPDNPYADGGGRPEIWAYGLRNPWKFSFDAETGDLVIADVGQNAYEEIDWLAAGTEPPVNFGWPRREGTHKYRSDDASGTVEPILDYPHDTRCSISGGYVYRGTKIPDLVGTYLYSDNCDGKIRGTLVGRGSTTRRSTSASRAARSAASARTTPTSCTCCRSTAACSASTPPDPSSALRALRPRSRRSCAIPSRAPRPRIPR